MAEPKPRISIEYSSGITIISFTDEKILEDTDIKALQESLMAVIEDRDAKKIVLDFSNVKFLSSAVLGLLIRISKKVYEKDGELVFCNISDNIKEIFKITKLIKIFDIYPDLESAKEQLSG